MGSFGLTGGLEGLLGGIAGGLAGAAPVNTTGSSSGSTISSSTIQSLLNTLSQLQSQQASTSATTPTLSPAAQQFQSNLINQYSNLQGQTNLQPYQAQQTQNINTAANMQSQAVNNIMAARGLSTSPVAGTSQANIQAQRFGNITNLQQSIPLLQQQLGLQTLGAGTSLFSQVPRGSTTSTSATGSQTGSTYQTGNTNTTGQQNTQNNYQQQQGGGAMSGFAGGLAGLLAGLFP